MSYRSFWLIFGLIFSTSVVHAENPTFGPSLLVGFPHPINLSVDKRVTDKYSAGIAAGALSLTLQSSGIKVSVSNFEVRGRWHPFSGSFILGGILGYQHLVGSGSTSILVLNANVPTTVNLIVNSLFFTPHLGWFWTWSSGFTLGFELGLQIPLSPKSTLDVTIDDPLYNSLLDLVKLTSPYQKLESDIEGQANRLAKSALPYATALRLGWMF